jgi:benzoylformate decarboxylase
LGNSVGALYQAKRGHAPLVVLGGDAGVKYQAMDAQMAADLVAMAEPVTKWAKMATHPQSVLRLLRRAVKIAATPPMGPVYLCLPQDILDCISTERVEPTSIPNTRTAPEEWLLLQAARWLAASDCPMLFVGDGVAYSQAQSELTRVAELLGAEVWSVDSGELNMSFAHPLFQGSTGHMFGQHSLPITQRGDVNLVVGTYMMPEVFSHLGDIFAQDGKVIHIDLDSDAIAKNHRVDLGLVADPKTTLGRLANILQELRSDDQQLAAQERITRHTEHRNAMRAQEIKQDDSLRDSDPLQFSQFVAELSRQLPADAIIFDEALTNSPALTRYCTPTTPGAFFQTRGGSLGVGFPGAVGVKVANPDKTVVGVSGDGGSMYTIQALWSAVRHNVAAKFIVCNNRSYRLLQMNIQQFWSENEIPAHPFPLSFDLSKPDVRFAEMAESMGVPAVRVQTSGQIAPAIEQALQHVGPFLIEVILEGDVHPEMVGVRCGQ